MARCLQLSYLYRSLVAAAFCCALALPSRATPQMPASPNPGSPAAKNEKPPVQSYLSLWNPLVEAATRGNLAQVRALIAKGGDVNSYDSPKTGKGLTPLIAATERGRIDIMRVLLDAGANPNARDFWEQTALKFAAASNKLAAVTLLLDRGADATDIPRRREPNALMEAASRGNLDIMDRLIARGANVNTATTDGTTALMFAAASGKRAAVERLIMCGANVRGVDNRGDSPIQYAVAGQQPALVVYLMAHGGDLTVAGPDALLLAACLLGDVKRARQALDVGAAPNVSEAQLDSPLTMAASQGHIAVLDLLLKRGADINGVGAFKEKPALCTAIDNHQAETARFLLERGADPEAQTYGGTALIHAVESKQTEIVRWLLARKVHLDTQSVYDKSTALGEAIGWRNDVLARLLLNAGANPNTPSGNSAEPPLVTAVVRNRSAVVTWLLARGADVNAADSYGNTALSQAIWPRNDVMVRLLLKSGANPNVGSSSSDGYTPLMSAAEYGFLDSVRHLIAAGANVNAKDKKGASILHHVRRPPQYITSKQRLHSQEIADLLEKAGAVE